MIVLASDYKEQLLKSYDTTKDSLIRALNSEELTPVSFYVEPYDTPKFWDILSKADGLITAFLPINENFLEKAPKLKAISVNATGYSTLDMEALTKHGVMMRHITSYCTREVAEHAIAMMLSLNKNFLQYSYEINSLKKWKYMDLSPRRTVNHLTLTIFGLGQIGKMTASLANALGMKVQAFDPYVDRSTAQKNNVDLVDLITALETSDVIINHMVLTDSNRNFFNEDFFVRLKKRPIFINVGRGKSVDEKALLSALEKEYIYAVGLDVLESEDPDMNNCPFTGMKNVLLTPHSAFYSEESNRALEEISGENMGIMLKELSKSFSGENK